MAKWASQGWDEAESQAASAANFTRDFFITDGDEARIRVLSEEPFNIRDHYVKNKGWFTCSQGLYDEDCPLCAAGFKATNHFIFQVFDPREYKDKNDVLHKDEVKIWRVGIKLLKLLKLKAKKYGPLTKYNIDVSRIGSGTNTAYSIDIDIDSLNKEFELPTGAELYDLMTVLEPKSPEDLKGILTGVGRPAPSNSGGFTEVNGYEEDEEDDGEVERLWGKK